ncbi:hypothetical protein A6R68_21369, partial [Neotoma lepida]
MTAELKKTMGRAPWGPVKVKKEEDEDESISQASSQQVYSENVKVWAPGEGPYLSIDVSEEEEKGQKMFWDMAMVLKATQEAAAAAPLGSYSLPGTLAKSEILEPHGNPALLGTETKNLQLLVPKTEICDEAEEPPMILGRIQKGDFQGPELAESYEKGNVLKRQKIKREKRDIRKVTVKDCPLSESFREDEDQKSKKSRRKYSLSSGPPKNQKIQPGQKPFTCNECGKGF